MKLAFVIEHFDPSRGGPERLAAWLAAEMARRGHDVHILCHDVAARVSRYRQATLRASFDAHRSRHAHGSAVENAQEHLHIHRLKGLRLHTALGFRLFGRRARAWCRRAKAHHAPFDVIHSFTVACPGDIYHGQSGVFAAMRLQAAAMRGDNGSAWKRLLQRLPGKQRTLLALERRAVDSARRIISSCAMMTRQYQAHYAARRGLVTLVTPGLDMLAPMADGDATARNRAWFRAHYRLDDADRVALFVGHDYRRKGLRHAIEAIARTPDWKLIVVGLGKVREYVELATALRLMPSADAALRADAEGTVPPARVMFVGPTRELPAIYAAADALLLPTYYEPSSVVTLEALAHGLPVVASAYLGIADFIADRAVGTIVADPHDADALATGLCNLPRPGTPEARTLAERCRKAAGSLSAPAFADQIEALYHEVVRELAR